MSALDDVKKWMNFMGWSDGGSPGSVKRDADGKTIAHSGDATWIDDVRAAIQKSESDAARAELERRGRL